MNDEIAYIPELIRRGRSTRPLTVTCRYGNALVRVRFEDCLQYSSTAHWTCPGCLTENSTNINQFFNTDDELIEDEK